MKPRKSSKYVKRVTSRAGVTYFYFQPPKFMSDHRHRGYSLGSDERIAFAKAQEILFCGVPDVAAVSRQQLNSKYLREAFREAKQRAGRKSLPFTIELGFIEKMMVDQDFRCALSDIEFCVDKMPGAYHRPFVASIDRIDSDRGYEPGNVRLVCLAVNIARGAWGDDVFARIVTGAATRLHLWGEAKG